MLFGVGLAGFVAPAIFGLPFMVAGGMILCPKNTQRLHKLIDKSDSNPALPAVGIKQVSLFNDGFINRYIDDLERPYPRSNKPNK
jgi:hypothetical protein